MKERYFAAAIVLISFVVNATAGEPRSGLGTLTCLSGDRQGNSRTVDCTLKPVAGIVSRFRGEISRPAQASTVKSQRVLVWYVYGPEGTRPKDLEGMFVRDNKVSNTGEVNNMLVGGKTNSISLQPPTNRDQLPGDDALTVLELKLHALNA